MLHGQKRGISKPDPVFRCRSRRLPSASLKYGHAGGPASRKKVPDPFSSYLVREHLKNEKWGQVHFFPRRAPKAECSEIMVSRPLHATKFLVLAHIRRRVSQVGFRNFKQLKKLA